MSCSSFLPRKLCLHSLCLIAVFTVAFCCIGSSSFSSDPAAVAGAGGEYLRGRNVARAALNEQKAIYTDKCLKTEYGGYRAAELYRLASLHPAPAEYATLNHGNEGETQPTPHSADPLSDALLLSCSFDSDEEKCAWQSTSEFEPFRRARFESKYFRRERFDCSNERKLQLDGFFLLTGGDPNSNREVSAALEADIPCQQGKATLKFDYWSINETPVLRICVVPEQDQVPQCEESRLDANPLTFEIPQSLKPFRLRIQADHVGGRDDLVLLDNIQYEGELCQESLDGPPVTERAPSAEAMLSTPKRSLDEKTKSADKSVDIYAEEELDEADEEEEEEEKDYEEIEEEEEEEEDGEEGESEGGRERGLKRVKLAKGAKGEVEPTKLEKEGPEHASTGSRGMAGTAEEQTEQLTEGGNDNYLGDTKSATTPAASFGPTAGQPSATCSALQCDFNAGDACGWTLTGKENTASWKIGKGPIGNPHTGVHKGAPKDPKIAGIAYAGSESADLQPDAVFVLESPPVRVDNRMVLVFDLFQRSVGPELKVCLNTPKNCPYLNPSRPNKSRHWFSDQRVILREGTERILFIATKLRRNLYLAVDNIRLQTLDLSDELCAKRETPTEGTAEKR